MHTKMSSVNGGHFVSTRGPVVHMHKCTRPSLFEIMDCPLLVVNQYPELMITYWHIHFYNQTLVKFEEDKMYFSTQWSLQIVG